ERCQKDEPTQTGKRHQHAQNSRQKGRLENEVAEQEAIGSEKCQAVDFVGSAIKEAKKIVGASRKAEERREQREAIVHRPEHVIEEQRHEDVERVGDDVDGII